VIYSARPSVLLVPPAGRVVRLNGVGFKSFRRADWLVFQLGYSHYVAARVTGLGRPRRGALAVADPAGVTRLRRPDPYKARGAYVDGARPTLKEGKRR
jgi:ribosomal protein L6P/L9E